MARAALVVVALLSLLAAPTATAKDMNGKFGIGFTQTLGGVTGLSARYFASRKWAIELDLGASLIDRDQRRASTEVLVAAGIFYNLVAHRHANLMVGVRGDLGFRTAPDASAKQVRVGEAIDTESQSTTPEEGDTPFQINVEIPLIIEYFFSDSFSINVSFGFVVVFAPDDGPIMETTGPGTVLESGEVGVGIGAGGLLGSAGANFYF